MKKMERDAAASKLMGAMTGVLFGGVLALGVCLLFLLLCALGIDRGWFPVAWMYRMTVVGCLLGSFTGGLAAAGKWEGGKLLAGLGAGGVFFLLLLTLAVLLFEDAGLENGGLGLLCACLCGGALAGLFTARPRKKRKKRP